MHPVIVHANSSDRPVLLPAHAFTAYGTQVGARRRVCLTLRQPERMAIPGLIAARRAWSPTPTTLRGPAVIPPTTLVDRTCNAFWTCASIALMVAMVAACCIVTGLVHVL